MSEPGAIATEFFCGSLLSVRLLPIAGWQPAVRRFFDL